MSWKDMLATTSGMRFVSRIRGSAPEHVSAMDLTSSAADAEELAASRAAKRMPVRSVKMQAMVAACALVVALAILAVIAWRGMQHLDSVDSHLMALTRLQQAGLRLEELSVEDRNDVALLPASMKELRQELASIAALNSLRDPESPRLLAGAEAALTDLSHGPQQSLLTAIEKIRTVLAAEVLEQGNLVAEVRHDLVLEFSATGVAELVLIGLALLILIRMRRRVIGPLAMLEHLLSLMARREYSPASTKGIDPIVLPVTTSYNRLVTRLVELEAENARHREELQHEVRRITEALLEQQRSLAVAERLAATGEVAARIAHELRNPLAGMQMALTNIRAEVGGRIDVVERMDLVIDELRRVTGLLNGLLDQSHITPEPAVALPIDKTVSDLLAVVRYQIPMQIALNKDIPDEVVCQLPKDRIRQVLLNLILNAADAIGDRQGEILVRAVVADGKLELTVSDSGPGLPDDLLRDGIRPFRTGRTKGTGLGLSIVSRLVRDLDGQMELRNLEPHGACVQLTLPCRGTHG